MMETTDGCRDLIFLFFNIYAMELFNNVQLYKSRSYKACVTDAHKMFYKNIKTIFRNTWLASLIVAVTTAIYMYFYTEIATADSINSFPLGFTLSLIAMVCAFIVFTAKVMTLLNKQPMILNLKKGFKAVICTCIIYLIIFCLTFFVYYNVTNGTMTFTNVDQLMNFTLYSAAICITMMFLTQPLIYSFMKYFMEKECKLYQAFTKYYIRGLRHYGFIFITWFITFLISFTFITIVSTPITIVHMARNMSMHGIKELGDPTGLPSYFELLAAGSTTVSIFISLYITIVTLFIFTLIYGSVETRIKEKQEFTKSNK